jgi:rhomboid protease GluP
MCPHCRAFITTDDKVCPYCDTPVGPRAVDRRQPGEIVGGLIPHARFTTTLILLINSGLYIAMVLSSMKAGAGGLTGLDPQTLVNFGAMYPPAIHAGQWWRLITAGFLHGGVLHILMNSWVLFDLGAQTEEFFGTSRMIVIYVAATIGGFYASYHWSPLSVGASAGLFGLIGAMIAFGIHERSHYGAALRSFYVRWAVYGLAIGFLFPNIDMAAHIGGLIAGFAVAYIAGTPRLTGSTETIWRILAGLSAAATLLAFVQMFSWMMRASRMGF